MKELKKFIFFVFNSAKEKSAINPIISNKISKIKTILFLLIFNYIISVISVFIITYLTVNNVISEPHHSSPNSEKSIFIFILSTVIIIPLIEEIKFRSWIIYNRIGISTFISVYFLSVGKFT